MKKKLIFLGIVLGSLLPMKVGALTGNVSLNCNKTSLSPNESTTCTITGKTSEEVSTVSAKIRVGSNLTLTSVKTSSIWQGDGEDGNIDLYTDINKTGTFAIATFTVTAGSGTGNTELSIQSIYFSDASFEQFLIPSVSKTIAISIPVVTPPEEEKKEEPNHTNPSVPGNNQTTSQKSSDASLKSVTLDIDTFRFDKSTTEYHLEVGNEKETITLKTEASHEKATVTLPSDLHLNVGENTFEIKVTAEDGTTSTYKFYITRLAKEKSHNAYLSDLKIKDYAIDFKKETNEYYLEKVNGTKLDLTITVEDVNATYQVYGNSSLTNQDVVVIKVTAEDGTTNEYLIYVKEVVGNKKNNFMLYLLTSVLLISLTFNILVIVKKVKAKRS